MWNLMKAQNFQIKGDNITIYALLFMLLGPVGLTLAQYEFQTAGLTGGMLMAQMGDVFAMVVVMMFVVLVTRICGWDMNDKTINYEVMTGHVRGKVYFSRVIVSLIWCVTGGVIALILPLAAFSLINGWGVNMNMEDLTIRIVLMLFVLFRLVSEIAFLTFLTGKGNSAMVVGFAILGANMLGQMLLQEFAGKTITLLTAYANLSFIFDFSNFKLEYIEGKDIPVFLTQVSADMMIGTVGVSWLVGVGCLALGYRVFQKKDMN